MKKILFCFSFIFFSNFIYAQLTPSKIGEVYDFSVGDTFQYSHRNTLSQDISSYSREFIVVEDKYFSMNNDTVFYTFKYSKKEYYSHYNNTGYNYYDGINNVFYTSLDSLIIPIPEPLNCFLFCDSFSCLNNSSIYCDFTTFYDSVYLGYNGRKTNERNRGYNSNFSMTNTIYTEGLGLIFSIDAPGSPIWKESKLIYYHKASGEKWGSPYYFIIVGTNKIIEPHADIAPNPANKELIVTLRNKFGKNSSNIQFTIYDLYGQNKYTQNIIQDKNIVSVENLSDGLYYWKITSDGYLLQQGKFIKNK
jgi:hypothetical protein